MLTSFRKLQDEAQAQHKNVYPSSLRAAPTENAAHRNKQISAKPQSGTPKNASDRGISEHDCRERLERIKPKGTLPPPPETGTSDSEVGYAEGWNANLDGKLMELKTNHQTYNAIAGVLCRSADECRQRFKQIKPKGWKPKTKKQMRKEKKSKGSLRNVLVEATPTLSTVEDKVESVAASTKNDGGWGAFTHCKECGYLIEWCGCTTPAPIATTEPASHQEDDSGADAHVCGGNCWGRCMLDSATDYKSCGHLGNCWCAEPDPNPVFIAPSSPASGVAKDSTWGVADCDDCGKAVNQCVCSGWPSEPAQSFAPFDFVAPARRSGESPASWANLGSDDGFATKPEPQPQPAPYVPYTVTYWATIESGSKEIHVPIDSKHVSGPEKSITNGGMQKVWKWVHEKGLGDKVSLQDAFDLAQSMHEGEDMEAETEKVDRKVESRLSYRSPDTDSGFGCW